MSVVSGRILRMCPTCGDQWDDRYVTHVCGLRKLWMQPTALVDGYSRYAPLEQGPEAPGV